MNMIKLKKHTSDRPHGIVKSNVGMFISLLFSLFVKLDEKVLL